jgi:hypothetical protein
MRRLDWKLQIVFALVVLLGGCAKPAPDSPQLRFKDLYRSIRQIEGATAVGMTHLRMGELLQGAAGEILIASDIAASPEEKEMVSIYQQALAIYGDSQKVWAKQIEYSSEQEFKGYIPVEGEVEPIAEKYKLQVVQRKTRYGTAWQGIPENGAIQGLWSKAGESGEKARRAYFALGAKKVSPPH